MKHELSKTKEFQMTIENVIDGIIEKTTKLVHGALKMHDGASDDSKSLDIVLDAQG